MSAVLNLSNEVVKLRPEVKRVKVLIIRKLIRHVSALEKKQGNQADMEKHRRRAARLHEEIRKLKVISPDTVTKAALQKDISFENVCKSKEASVSERAIARIATHPQFSKRIQSIKEAITAFKEERINARKAEKQAKNHAEDIRAQEQPQEGIDADDEVSEKLDNEVEEKLKIEDDKIVDKEEVCDSSPVSRKISLEASNEPTKGPETQMSTTQDSKQVSIPEEVIRMRKVVKRTRVLVISKLTQQVAVLKKTKGQESDVKQSQELAANLIKEIQALRSLNPDQVTMTALQENIDLDKVLKDPQISSLDRAIARIGTHSRFINKLQKVKEAIVAERTKAAEAKEKKKERQAMVSSKIDVIHDVNDNGDNEENEEDEEDDDNEEDEDVSDNKIGEKKLESPSIEICKSVEPTESTDFVKLLPLKEITSTSEKSREAKGKSQNADATASQSSPEKSLTVSSTESTLPRNITKPDKETENIIKPGKKQDLPETKQPESKKDEESDLSDDDEEKEYFDDSTEERFHKQSSQSEESDEDDFFVGKVSKFKKKKSSQCKAEKKEGETQKADKLQNVEKATGKGYESNLGKLQSVFCSALSKSSISQNAKHRSQPNGPRPPRFQNQKGGSEGKMKPSLYKEPGTARKAAPFKHDKQTFKFAGQRQGGPSGSGRGNSHFEQHQNLRGPSGRISNVPQQSLHPSWEASRKRKEQQAQITAFQGKKIRFDDDD